MKVFRGSSGATNQVDTLNHQKPNRARQCEFGFWIFGVTLGFIHCLSNHFYITNSDALAYLDIAEAYLKGDWQTAINAYWSPLYSWVIAVGLLIVRPSPFWKFSLLHWINFAIYLFSFGCFRFFIRELIRVQKDFSEPLGESAFAKLPDWGWLALGYSLFIWSSLFLVGVGLESPDQLLAGLVYLSSGTLLLINRRRTSWLPFAMLGLSLGLGFLAKTVMLPLAAAFLIGAVISVGNLRKSLPRIAIALSVLVLVVAPFVTAISLKQGRLTFGDSGRLNYIWVTQGVPYTNWPGEIGLYGTRPHRVQKIFDNPTIYWFPGKLRGTYPLMFDPPFWYEGKVGNFSFKQQIKVLLKNFESLYDLYLTWGIQSALLTVLLALFLISDRRFKFRKDLAPTLSLLVPAIASIGGYLLISVQGRYLAPFLILLWLALFSGLRVPNNQGSGKLMVCLTIALTATIVLTIIASSVNEARATTRYLLAGADVSANEHWLVAAGLSQMGVVRGDYVAVLGYGPRAFWAHLSGLQIVAEIENKDIEAFWSLEPSSQQRALEALARCGAKALITDHEPRLGFNRMGWRKIGNTDYHLYLLQ